MIDVNELDHGVKVVYTSESGDTATATVIGEPLSSVEDRAEEIVENHNLREKV